MPTPRPITSLRANGQPRRFGPVQVRRVDPGRGWSLEDARGLLQQGYSSDHVARLTGFSTAMLLAPVKSRRR